MCNSKYLITQNFESFSKFEISIPHVDFSEQFWLQIRPNLDYNIFKDIRLILNTMVWNYKLTILV